MATGTDITRVGPGDLDELLPLIRAYCDFYEVAPSDEDLIRLSRALIDDPEHEGLQLIARERGGEAVGFATIYWTWSTTAAARIGVMNDLVVAQRAQAGPQPGEWQAHGGAREPREPQVGEPHHSRLAALGRQRRDDQPPQRHAGVEQRQVLDHMEHLVLGGEVEHRRDRPEHGRG